MFIKGIFNVKKTFFVAIFIKNDGFMLKQCVEITHLLILL